MMRGPTVAALLILLLVGPAIQLVAQEAVPKPENDTAALLQAAQRGDVTAQFNLGLAYATGLGVPRDDAEAARWYRRAAEQGHAAAQDALGWAHTIGQGVPKDEAEAVRWYRRAAEQGHAKAQFDLGSAASQGFGVPKDDAEAARCYRKAAEQGYDRAQHTLGLAYANGLGVPKDEAEAVRWYREAAEQGHAKAQFDLATSYATGQGGLLRSGATAAVWYYKAGQSFLKEGSREDALLCVERIRSLQKQFGLIPYRQLAGQLHAAISGAVPSPGPQKRQ